MGRTARFDESGDSEELQALFDSFAAPPPRPRLELVVEPGSTDEANGRPEQLANVERGSGGDGWAGLVSARPRADYGTQPAPRFEEDAPRNEQVPGILPELLGGLGPLLRHVYESLDAMDYGYPRENPATPGSAEVRRPVRTLQMAQLAASRVINATEVAKAIQTSVGRHAAELSAQWERLFTSRMGVEEFEQLARNTRGFLDSLPEQSRMTEDQLTEIILAQYVQDSVFPVIKRLTDMANQLEAELARVVAAIAPPERLPDRTSSQSADARGGRSASMGHGQIGDLLKGLGF
jgi:chemotaxis protein CheZ